MCAFYIDELSDLLNQGSATCGLQAESSPWHLTCRHGVQGRLAAVSLPVLQCGKAVVVAAES